MITSKEFKTKQELEVFVNSIKTSDIINIETLRYLISYEQASVYYVVWYIKDDSLYQD